MSTDPGPDPAPEPERTLVSAMFRLTTAIRGLPQIGAVGHQMPWGDRVTAGDLNEMIDYLLDAAACVSVYTNVVKTMQSTYTEALSELTQFRQDQAAVRRYLGINQAPTAQ